MMKVSELFEDKWDDAKAKYKANAKAKRVTAQDSRRAEKTKAGGELIDRVKKLPSYKAMTDLADDRTDEVDLRKQILYFRGHSGGQFSGAFEFEVSSTKAKFKRQGSSSWSTIKDGSLYDKADKVTDDNELAGFDRSLQIAHEKLRWEKDFQKRYQAGELD
jgi:hypothetical protein